MSSSASPSLTSAKSSGISPSFLSLSAGPSSPKLLPASTALPPLPHPAPLPLSHGSSEDEKGSRLSSFDSIDSHLRRLTSLLEPGGGRVGKAPVPSGAPLGFAGLRMGSDGLAGPGLAAPPLRVAARSLSVSPLRAATRAGGPDSPPAAAAAPAAPLSGIFSRRRRSSLGALSSGSGASAASLLRALEDSPAGARSPPEWGALGLPPAPERDEAEEAELVAVAPLSPSLDPEPASPSPSLRFALPLRAASPRASPAEPSSSRPLSLHASSSPTERGTPSGPASSRPHSFRKPETARGLGSLRVPLSVRAAAGADVPLQSGRTVKARLAKHTSLAYSLVCPTNTPAAVSVQALHGAVSLSVRFVADGEPPAEARGGPWRAESTEEAAADVAVPAFPVPGYLLIAVSTDFGAQFALAGACEPPEALKIGRLAEKTLERGEWGHFFAAHARSTNAARSVVLELGPGAGGGLATARSGRSGASPESGEDSDGAGSGDSAASAWAGDEAADVPPVAAYCSSTEPYPRPNACDFALTPSRPRIVLPSSSLGETLFVAVVHHSYDRRTVAASLGPRAAGGRRYTLAAAVMKSTAQVAGVFLAKSLFARASAALSMHAAGAAAPSQAAPRGPPASRSVKSRARSTKALGTLSLRARPVRPAAAAPEGEPEAAAARPPSFAFARVRAPSLASLALSAPGSAGPAFPATAAPPTPEREAAWAPDPTDLPLL